LSSAVFTSPDTQTGSCFCREEGSTSFVLLLLSEKGQQPVWYLNSWC